MNFPTRFVSFLLLAAGLAGCASTPLPSTPVARGDMAAVQRQLEAFIAREMGAERIAGVSIALVDDQRTVWARGFGWADKAGQRPAGAETLYRMGSISKLVTDTAAMQLVAQGRLDLDAPVQAALPDFRIRTRWGDAPITLRQLMTHHAGLPRDVLGGMWGSTVGDWRAAVLGLSNADTAGPSGRAFAYSNIGLDVVGLAVERAAGVTFEAQVQRAVLEPIGMHEASFSAAVPGSPRMAQAYRKGEPRTEPALRDVPAGGLTASVDDMAKFIALQFAQGRNARGEVVLPQAQWAEMLRVQNDGVALDADFQVGIGWMFTTFGLDTVHGGGPVAHHAGATHHHRAQLMMLPEQKLGVVVAANDAAAGRAVSRIAQRALALMLEARSGVRQPERVPGFVPARVPWTDAQRRACVGDHVSVVGGLSIRLDGTRLLADWNDTTLDLLEGEGGRLGVRYRLAGLIPIPLGGLERIGLQCEHRAGHDVLLGHLDGIAMVVGDRLPPPDGPVPPALAALAGRYVPVPAVGETPSFESVTLEVAGGRLWVRPTTAEAFGGDASVRFPVRVLSETDWLVVGLLADEGETLHLHRTPDGGLDVEFAGVRFVRADAR